MTTFAFRSILAALALALGAANAHAACVIMTSPSYPPNEVSLDLAALKVVDTSPVTVQTDMNGIQGNNGNPSIRWPTHGALVITVEPTGELGDWLVTWTRNLDRATEQYVCRLKFDATSGRILGTGNYHFFIAPAQHVTAAGAFARCELTLTDCP